MVGYILQEQSDHTLALALRGDRVVPETGKILCQGQDLLALAFIPLLLVTGSLLLIFLLGLVEMPQLLIPVRLQFVRRDGLG